MIKVIFFGFLTTAFIASSAFAGGVEPLGSTGVSVIFDHGHAQAIYEMLTKKGIQPKCIKPHVCEVVSKYVNCTEMTGFFMCEFNADLSTGVISAVPAYLGKSKGKTK